MDHVEVHQADHLVPILGLRREPERGTDRRADALAQDAVTRPKLRIVHHLLEQDGHLLLDDALGDGTTHPGDLGTRAAAASPGDELRRVALEEQDGPSIREDRVEELVEHELEELLEGPVNEQRAGRARQDAQGPALPDQLLRVEGGKRVHVLREAPSRHRPGLVRRVVSSDLLDLSRGEDHDVVTQTDPVARAEHRLRLEKLAVELGSVPTPQVFDVVGVSLDPDLGVATGEPLVRKRDLVVRRAADSGDLLMEPESLATTTGTLNRDLGHAVAFCLLWSRNSLVALAGRTP